MARRLRWSLGLVLAMFAIGSPSGAAAAIAPPWCGTPEPDAAANLPDGSSPSHPAGSFPHIPYYAIGCTLEDIAVAQRRAHDGRGHRPVRARPRHVRRHDQRAEHAAAAARLRQLARRPRADAQETRAGEEACSPSTGRHQGADLHPGQHPRQRVRGRRRRDATRSSGSPPRRTGPNATSTTILDHAVARLQPDPEPGRPRRGHARERQRLRPQPRLPHPVAVRDDRVDRGDEGAGCRRRCSTCTATSNPTLVEATTKPHNPGIEYDLWLKWNQPRIDYNEQALAAIGQDITRPINDWCPEDGPPSPTGLCDAGETPGPDVAEGWDDWGPFYSPMYMQHVGLDSIHGRDVR